MDVSKDRKRMSMDGGEGESGGPPTKKSKSEEAGGQEHPLTYEHTCMSHMTQCVYMRVAGAL